METRFHCGKKEKPRLGTSFFTLLYFTLLLHPFLFFTVLLSRAILLISDCLFHQSLVRTASSLTQATTKEKKERIILKDREAKWTRVRRPQRQCRVNPRARALLLSYCPHTPNPSTHYSHHSMQQTRLAIE